MPLVIYATMYNVGGLCGAVREDPPCLVPSVIPTLQGVTTLCWAMATSLEAFGSALDCATYLGDHRPNDHTLKGKFFVGISTYFSGLCSW